MKGNFLKNVEKYFISKDNSQNDFFITDVPDICKKKACMLGVDEAGRGPVLGPMVYGVAYCPVDSEQILTDLACADSKQLTEERREFIFDNMNTKEDTKLSFGWAVEVISPSVISTSMNRRSKCSLNEISMNSAIGLIRRVIEGNVNITHLYVDTVGPPEKYEAKLKDIFPQLHIIVSKKADSLYAIVSAASICAKVVRDSVLKIWHFPENAEMNAEHLGSGYPVDPATNQFLSNNSDFIFGYPRLVRFSWSTAENSMLHKSYNVEFKEVNAGKFNSACTKLSRFSDAFVISRKMKRKRNRFLRERFLDNVIEIIP